MPITISQACWDIWGSTLKALAQFYQFPMDTLDNHDACLTHFNREQNTLRCEGGSWKFIINGIWTDDLVLDIFAITLISQAEETAKEQTGWTIAQRCPVHMRDDVKGLTDPANKGKKGNLMWYRVTVGECHTGYCYRPDCGGSFKLGPWQVLDIARRGIVSTILSREISSFGNARTGETQPRGEPEDVNAEAKQRYEEAAPPVSQDYGHVPRQGGPESSKNYDGSDSSDDYSPVDEAVRKPLELEDLKRQLRELDSDNNQLRNSNDNLEAQRVSHLSEKEKLRAEHEKLRKMFTELQAASENERAKWEEALDRLESFSRHNVLLKNMWKAGLSESKKLSEENKDLRKKLTELQENSQKSQIKWEEDLQRLDAVSMENVSLKTYWLEDVKDVRERQIRLYAEIQKRSKSREDLESVSRDHAILREKWDELQRENNELRAKMEKDAQRNQLLESEIGKIRESLANMSRTMSAQDNSRSHPAPTDEQPLTSGFSNNSESQQADGNDNRRSSSPHPRKRRRENDGNDD